MNSDSLVQLGNGMAARISPGSGDKVLWIHGYTIDSSLWRELWDRLPDWHHIGIDLPGHGASPSSTTKQSLPEVAQSIGKMAIEHEVNHVVGLSFGSMIALQVVIEAPNAFASLILGAPALGGGPQDPMAKIRYLELVKLFRGRGPGPWMTELWMASPPDIFKGASVQPHLWQELTDVVNRHSWSELADGSMQRLTTFPQTVDTLRRICASTLILVGEEEMSAFKCTAELLQRAISTCESVCLLKVGHLCMLEAPDVAGKLIDTHLTRASIRSQ